MQNIEVTFTNMHSGDVISWDVFPWDLDLSRELESLRRRYPSYEWGYRHTGAPVTVGPHYWRRP